MQGLQIFRGNAAIRRYSKGVLQTMSVYVVILLGVSYYVVHHHPRGVLVYVLAVMPTIPILAMLAVVGIYLRDEKDEFLRWMMVRSLLWATGIVLAATTAAGFLETIAQVHVPPAFYVFVLFWIVFGVAQTVQAISNRVKQDD